MIGLLVILWMCSGIGAASYAAFSTKELTEVIFWDCEISKRDFEDRLFLLFGMGFLGIVVGPFMWIYVVYRHHTALKSYFKQKEIEVGKDVKFSEQFVDKIFDLEKDQTG